jgi:NADH/NAD ratio-sensing transcriptional regulator Rex
MLKTLKATLLASTIAITSVPSAQAASKEIVDVLVLGGILGIIAIAAGQGATADSQRAEAIDVITDVQGALN